MALHLYLIRHGETAWSLTRSTDIPLAEHGKNEARKLGAHLCGISFGHILRSPLQRACVTCHLVDPGRVAEIERDLVDGTTAITNGDNPLTSSRSVRRDIFRDGCTQEEMPSRVSARANRLIARLRALDGNVALFWHGQFGGVLCARRIGLPLEKARHSPRRARHLRVELLGALFRRSAIARRPSHEAAGHSALGK